MNTMLRSAFRTSEVAADWHELMIPQSIMRPFIAGANEQLDPRCSMQTTPPQSATLGLYLVARKLYSFPIPLRVGG